MTPRGETKVYTIGIKTEFTILDQQPCGWIRKVQPAEAGTHGGARVTRIVGVGIKLKSDDGKIIAATVRCRLAPERPLMPAAVFIKGRAPPVPGLGTVGLAGS